MRNGAQRRRSGTSTRLRCRCGASTRLRVRMPLPGLTCALLASLLLPGLAPAADIEAAAPAARSVTVYRAVYRLPARHGRLDLENLAGFALVTETRTVSLPAGDSRLRFTGVADGIEARSAILTGLPEGVLEKNRDAQVLSPSALVAATRGAPVTLVRTNRKTGRATRTRGTLRATNDGVLFESPAGVEALRCSGLPETFTFSGTAELFPTPTLSVKVRSSQALAATVTLSYLAHGFDWAATYSATLAADARTLDLGAWVTLANSNAVPFPDSQVAVVAGRLNRESPDAEPLEGGTAIMAQCWPTSGTSDIPEEERPPAFLEKSSPMIEEDMVPAAPEMAAAARLVEEEQLGDLKLYRVPEVTSVNALQMKQVRLLDRAQVPVELLYVADLNATEEAQGPALRMLRTRNDAAHHLGLPLPSGTVATFVRGGDTPLLLAEAPLRDIAVNEDFEIPTGEAPDVQVRAVNERTVVPASLQRIPLLPGVLELKTGVRTTVSRIEITNARRTALTFEARLSVPAGFQLVRSSVAPQLRDGRQVLRIQIAAGGRAVIRYAAQRRVSRRVRPR